VQSRFYAAANLGLIDCNAVALGIVSTSKLPACQAPRLAAAYRRRTAAGERGPDSEYQRRRRIRRLNEQLSRYYVLPEGDVEWTCPGLLSRGEHNYAQLYHDIPLTHIFLVLRDVKRAPKPCDAPPG
jgi:hypothetical protein